MWEPSKYLAAALFLGSLSAIAAPKRDLKFEKRIIDDLRFDRNLIASLRVSHENDLHYTETVEAYHNAMADLEDFQNSDPRITRERIENDAQEVWMDLAPYRDSTGVMR